MLCLTENSESSLGFQNIPLFSLLHNLTFLTQIYIGLCRSSMSVKKICDELSERFVVVLGLGAASRVVSIDHSSSGNSRARRNDVLVDKRLHTRGQTEESIVAGHPVSGRIFCSVGLPFPVTLSFCEDSSLLSPIIVFLFLL